MQMEEVQGWQVKQKGKKWAGEERSQGNNSKGTNAGEDKRGKWDSILSLEKYRSQSIAIICR